MVHDKAVFLVFSNTCIFANKIPQFIEALILQQGVKIFTMQRSKRKPLDDFVAIFIFSVFNGNAVYFFQPFIYPITLQPFYCFQRISNLRFDKKIFIMYKTMFIIKIELFLCY